MLINSTTDLNKLKFTSSGGDRWDRGNSGQPYIVTRIPGANDTFEQQLDGQPLPKGGVDFLLRGGLKSIESATNDVSRLTKLLFDTKSPNGFEFIAKQNVLSRQNVKTEASFGAGYAGGAVNQGVYLPLSTLGQTGVAPIAPGSFNLFGINPNTDNTPLSGERGLDRSNNAGINSYFHTVNTQNIVQDGSFSDSNRLILLNQAIYEEQEERTIGGNITLNPKNAGVNILNYGGGPGSILLFGKTNIRFSDQRTGLKNAKLPKGTNGQPSFINPTGPNNYSIFGSVLNETIEGSITGIPNTSTIGRFGTSPIIKSNIFHKGVTTAFLNSFRTQQLNEATNQLESIIDENLANQMSEKLSVNFLDINNYESQPPGGIYDFLPNVYEGGLDSTKSNEFITEKYSAQLLTQANLYTASLASGGRGVTLNPSDFRNVKRVPINQRVQVGTTGQGSLGVSSVLSLAPNYVTQNANIVFNQGDPGSGMKSINNQGTIGGKKNVYNYAFSPSGSMAKTALDRINALAMYESSSVDAISSTNDSCQFNIAVINNKDQGATNTYIHFRAFLDSFSDNYGANWSEVQYVGRAEKLYNYAGFQRDINMDFTVYAQSKAELIPMYKKLNYLASTLAPDYSEAGYMRGNIVKMTVGGYLYDQPGIIKSLNYTIPMESTWEIAINTNGGKDSSVKQLPHMIKVTGLTFTPIQKFVPARASDLKNPVEKYIALASDSKTTNYSDEYDNNFNAIQFEENIKEELRDAEVERIASTSPAELE